MNEKLTDKIKSEKIRQMIALYQTRQPLEEVGQNHGVREEIPVKLKNFINSEKA